MKKIMNWVLAATLVCGATVFTSCTSDTEDNPAQEQAKKNRKEFIQHTRSVMKDLAENLNFADENGYTPLTDLLDKESIAYGINIIDHAAEPMQQSIIIVRQLAQALQKLQSAFLQTKPAK